MNVCFRIICNYIFFGEVTNFFFPMYRIEIRKQTNAFQQKWCTKGKESPGSPLPHLSKPPAGTTLLFLSTAANPVVREIQEPLSLWDSPVEPVDARTLDPRSRARSPSCLASYNKHLPFLQVLTLSSELLSTAFISSSSGRWNQPCLTFCASSPESSVLCFKLTAHNKLGLCDLASLDACHDLPVAPQPPQSPVASAENPQGLFAPFRSHLSHPAGCPASQQHPRSDIQAVSFSLCSNNKPD